MSHGKEELLEVQNVVCHMESSCDLNQNVVCYNGKPREAEFHHLPAVNLDWTSCLIGMITLFSSCHYEM